jgi:hypothetical protein
MRYTVQYFTSAGHVGKLNVFAANVPEAQWTTVEYLATRGHEVTEAEVIAEDFSENVPTLNAVS